MSASSSPSDEIPMGNSGPPFSFLRQLLEEINGNDTGAASPGTASPQRTLASRTTKHICKKRRSSVWVGGEPIAQDARNKLRVADEARLSRASVRDIDGTPALEPTRQSTSLQNIGRSSSLQRNLSCPTYIHLNPEKPVEMSTSIPRSILHATNSHSTSPCRKPSLSDSHLSFAQSLVPPSDPTPGRAVSPLIFCDIDSDISLTSSDSELPTSATTNDSTQASTWSNGNHATRKSVSPGKRKRGLLDQPPTLSDTQSSLDVLRTSRTLGDDNRRLIRNTGFIERASALPVSISPRELEILPEVSSFRPDAKLAITPVRCAARRSSVPPNSPNYRPETPIWARSLHLVDSDFSLYKGPVDEQSENLLCLYCFSRHGNFRKMLPHGYETCGREEILDSHYWESIP